MDVIQAIADTLVKVMGPGMKRKAVFAAVREHHPKATNKEIVRAAFFALTDVSVHKNAMALDSQDFTLKERGLNE